MVSVSRRTGLRHALEAITGVAEATRERAARQVEVTQAAVTSRARGRRWGVRPVGRVATRRGLTVVLLATEVIRRAEEARLEGVIR